MKRHTWLLTTLRAATLALTGCSKSDSGTAGAGGSASAPASVDPSPIEKAFASAEPTLKAPSPLR